MSLYNFNNLSNIPIKSFPNLHTNNSFQITQPIDPNIMYYPYTYKSLSGPLGYQTMSQFSFSKSRKNKNKKKNNKTKKYRHKSIRKS